MRGRPITGPEGHGSSNHPITVRYGQGEKKTLKKLAKAHSMTISGWIRMRSLSTEATAEEEKPQ